MYLGRVIGTVVCERKYEGLEGKRLLVVQPLDHQREPSGPPEVAVDTVSAGFREHVIAVSGSSARMAEGCKDTPVDTAIIGIVDEVSMD